MTKINTLLAERLKSSSSQLSKMATLAEMSNKGTLSSFAGVFRVTGLSSSERAKLFSLLDNHKLGDVELTLDLEQLANLTAEVRAIHSQAVILHGERIKKAEELLKKYRDGAFTAWLLVTYGNRQTPYNFLQYYEFSRMIGETLLEKLDEIPKQIAYLLASRKGPLQEKEEFLRNYRGQSKQELLTDIRRSFPLARNDQRAYDPFEKAISTLRKMQQELLSSTDSPSAAQKEDLRKILQSLERTFKL